MNDPEAVAWLEGEGMEQGRAAEALRAERAFWLTPHSTGIPGMVEGFRFATPRAVESWGEIVHMPPPPWIDPIEGYGTGEIRGILGGITSS
jgi:hypothetical protein